MTPDGMLWKRNREELIYSPPAFVIGETPKKARYEQRFDIGRKRLSEDK